MTPSEEVAPAIERDDVAATDGVEGFAAIAAADDDDDDDDDDGDDSANVLSRERHAWRLAEQQARMRDVESWRATSDPLIAALSKHGRHAAGSAAVHGWQCLSAAQREEQRQHEQRRRWEAEGDAFGRATAAAVAAKKSAASVDLFGTRASAELQAAPLSELAQWSHARSPEKRRYAAAAAEFERRAQGGGEGGSGGASWRKARGNDEDGFLIDVAPPSKPGRVGPKAAVTGAAAPSALLGGKGSLVDFGASPTKAGAFSRAHWSMRERSGAVAVELAAAACREAPPQLTAADYAHLAEEKEAADAAAGEAARLRAAEEAAAGPYGAYGARAELRALFAGQQVASPHPLGELRTVDLGGCGLGDGGAARAPRHASRDNKDKGGRGAPPLGLGIRDLGATCAALLLPPQPRPKPVRSEAHRARRQRRRERGLRGGFLRLHTIVRLCSLRTDVTAAAAAADDDNDNDDDDVSAMPPAGRQGDMSVLELLALRLQAAAFDEPPLAADEALGGGGGGGDGDGHVSCAAVLGAFGAGTMPSLVQCGGGGGGGGMGWDLAAAALELRALRTALYGAGDDGGSAHGGAVWAMAGGVRAAMTAARRRVQERKEEEEEAAAAAAEEEEEEEVEADASFVAAAESLLARGAPAVQGLSEDLAQVRGLAALRAAAAAAAAAAVAALPSTAAAAAAACCCCCCCCCCLLLPPLLLQLAGLPSGRTDELTGSLLSLCLSN